MVRGGRLGRRAFLKSTAVGATSFAVGGSACSSKGNKPDAADGGPLDVGAPDGDALDAGALDGEVATDANDAGPEAEAAPDAGRIRPPNVLFILADQWRAQSIGYAGDPNAKTPNLDRLSGESVTFAHTGLVHAGLLSLSRHPDDRPISHGHGRLPQRRQSRAGSALARGEVQAAGYDTGYIGKWHLDGQGCRSAYTPPERRQGFSRWAAIECTHDYNHSLYYAGDDGTHRLTWPGYDAIAQTREMQRWLTERDPSTPFCYFLSWGPPHDPYDTAPAEFAAQFPPAAIQLRPNVPRGLRRRGPREPRRLLRPHRRARPVRRRAARNAGQRSASPTTPSSCSPPTTATCTARKASSRKQQPWDESILVPFLLRYPAGLGRSPRTIPMRLSTPDIMPTLLGLAGLTRPARGPRPRPLAGPAPGSGAGRRGRPHHVRVALRQSGTARSAAGSTAACARGRYTYVRDLAGPWLLYDNDTDPYQLNNLVDQPDYAAVRGRARRASSPPSSPPSAIRSARASGTSTSGATR